jgi:hypothetical protein
MASSVIAVYVNARKTASSQVSLALDPLLAHCGLAQPKLLLSGDSVRSAGSC